MLLLRFVAEQGSRVHWTLYHRTGNELGLPAPGQNGAFGGRVPSMVRDGEYRILTEVGRERAYR
jgi:hypothetical protein